MNQISILVNNKYLETVLINLIEIAGYLPYVFNEQNLKIKKNCKQFQTIITTYYYLQKDIDFLEKFNNIIVFVPYDLTLIHTDIKSTKNIIFFTKALTFNNIKSLFEDILYSAI